MSMSRQSICWTFMKQLFKIKHISIHKVRHKSAEVFSHSFISDNRRYRTYSSFNAGIEGRLWKALHAHAFISLLLWFWLSGSEICNGIAALEALWFMYSTQRLWEGMFRAFNHGITSLFLPPLSDVICQGLMNCWLCFSGGASLMYYRWTAGPGLLSVCIAYVESSLKSL